MLIDSASFGGEETELTYRVMGTIDRNAPFAKETTHFYITTQKDGVEALDVIPVKDHQFDDSFYLRFGPGKYEMIVSVTEIKEKRSNYFHFWALSSSQLIIPLRRINETFCHPGAFNPILQKSSRLQKSLPSIQKQTKT